MFFVSLDEKLEQHYNLSPQSPQRQHVLSVSDPTPYCHHGGPGGLSLLLTLVKRGVQATLYEHEITSDSRAHLGGMLDLRWDSGQRTFRENGMEDVFRKHSRRDAEEAQIDRRVLRQILLDAVPLDAVKWGHQLTSIRALGDGQHELTFATGLITVVGLVVGADGANSSVRPLLSSATPIFHGITGVEISLALTLASLPDNRDIIEGVGRGSLYAAEDDKILALHRNGDGRIRGYAWHQNTLEWSLPCDPKEARKTLLELYFDWAPWMRKFIEQGDESAIYPRPLFHLVVGYRWEHKPGVTVIGDAAHFMSPFARAGATLAMRDGLELGLVIAEAVSKGLGREEREVAVVRWEAEMFEKVEKFAALTASNLEVDISTSAPQSAVEAFTHSL
ncbi:monooxygenase FAD-binding protein [Trametes gibbosa]|nr:monooxygenase FAD-binding protein [Trametes gibbosa]